MKDWNLVQQPIADTTMRMLVFTNCFCKQISITFAILNITTTIMIIIVIININIIITTTIILIIIPPGVSVVTHIFGFLSGVEVGAMLLRDEIEKVTVDGPIMVDMVNIKKRGSLLENFICSVVTFCLFQPWERTVKTILWTFFCLGFGAAFGINIVGAVNFQGFWHQNFWDPDQVLFNMTSSCT